MLPALALPVPAAQAVHAAADVAPSMRLKVLGGHDSQGREAWVVKAPAWHCTQAVLPLWLVNEPSGQGRQTESGDGLYRPVVHTAAVAALGVHT
jgi:hypothetical protein